MFSSFKAANLFLTFRMALEMLSSSFALRRQRKCGSWHGSAVGISAHRVDYWRVDYKPIDRLNVIDG